LGGREREVCDEGGAHSLKSLVNEYWIRAWSYNRINWI